MARALVASVVVVLDAVAVALTSASAASAASDISSLRSVRYNHRFAQRGGLLLTACMRLPAKRCAQCSRVPICGYNERASSVRAPSLGSYVHLEQPAALGYYLAVCKPLAPAEASAGRRFLDTTTHLARKTTLSVRLKITRCRAGLDFVSWLRDRICCI